MRWMYSAWPGRWMTSSSQLHPPTARFRSARSLTHALIHTCSMWFAKPRLSSRHSPAGDPLRGRQVEKLASVQIWDVEVLVGVVWDRRTLVAKLGLHRDQANGNYYTPLRAACSNQSAARAWLSGRGGCMGSKRSVLGLGIVGRYSAGEAVYCA